ACFPSGNRRGRKSRVKRYPTAVRYRNRRDNRTSRRSHRFPCRQYKPMSNAPKKSIPRPGRKPTSEPAPVVTPQSASGVTTASQQIALLAARAGLDKKATGVEIIDVTGKVDYADYLVLMTGASDRNVAA